MRRALVFASSVIAIGIVSRSSDAHFELQSPPSWMSQDPTGSPQKMGPCGDEGGGTPSGVVTAYQVGDTITVTIDEKVFHPGHYRIALTTGDRNALPPEPKVAAGGGHPCGSVPIENPPVFPVLADGVFAHTVAFTAPQTTTVKLPPNVTCTHCTLQVIEFMSDHGLNPVGGCFYHHCADIAVGTDAGTPLPDASVIVDATADAVPDAPTGGEPEVQTSGCNCTSAPQSGTSFGGVTILAGFAALVSARRRRRGR